MEEIGQSQRPTQGLLLRPTLTAFCYLCLVTLRIQLAVLPEAKSQQRHLRHLQNRSRFFVTTTGHFQQLIQVLWLWGEGSEEGGLFEGLIHLNEVLMVCLASLLTLPQGRQRLSVEIQRNDPIQTPQCNLDDSAGCCTMETFICCSYQKGTDLR